MRWATGEATPKSPVTPKTFTFIVGGELGVKNGVCGGIMIVALIVFFFSGAFLCNSVPHFVAGVQGRPFPTPFAHPRGIGNSSSVVNFLWGFLNLVVGVLLFSRQPLTNYLYPNLTALFAGIFLMGLHLASHFGKVHRGEIKK